MRHETDLTPGTIKRCFPVVCNSLKPGKTHSVEYYGTRYQITRTGDGPYDFAAKKL